MTKLCILNNNNKKYCNYVVNLVIYLTLTATSSISLLTPIVNSALWKEKMNMLLIIQLFHSKLSSNRIGHKFIEIKFALVYFFYNTFPSFFLDHLFALSPSCFFWHSFFLIRFFFVFVLTYLFFLVCFFHIRFFSFVFSHFCRNIHFRFL